MQAQEVVEEIAIDLGEARWEYETAETATRPTWPGLVGKALAVVAVALGLLWGAGPASVPPVGEPLWSSATSMPGLGVTPSAILVAEAGNISARDPWTGHELWRAPVRGDISYVDPSVAGVLVALSYSPSAGESGSHLTAIDDRTGEILAELSGRHTEGQYPVGRSGQRLVLHNVFPRNELYDPCPGEVCSVLTAVDLRDGEIVWSYESREPEELLVEIVDDQLAALAYVGREGRVTFVDPADGSVQSMLDIGPVEQGTTAIAAGNLIVLRPDAGKAVISAYDIGSYARAWQATVALPGVSGYLWPCDGFVCIGHETGTVRLDGATGRVLDTRPDETGIRLASGVRIGFVEPRDGFWLREGRVAVVSDRGGRVIRRIEGAYSVTDGVFSASDPEWTDSAILLRHGTVGVDLFRVDGSGEVSWLGQLPSRVDWCQTHSELLTCWSYNEPTSWTDPSSRIWVWRLPAPT